jgi:hypothetical protein
MAMRLRFVLLGDANWDELVESSGENKLTRKNIVVCRGVILAAKSQGVI